MAGGLSSGRKISGKIGVVLTESTAKFPKTAVLEGKAVSHAPENALDRFNASQI
jgi:hypothetical protein